MNTSLLSMSVLLGGSVLLVLALRSRWPGWMGAPFAILAFRLWLEVGVAGVYRPPLSRADPVTGPALSSELGRASVLLLVGYGFLALGLVAVRTLLSGGGGDAGRPTPPLKPAAGPGPDRAWRASVILFVAGAAINSLTLGLLLTAGSLREVAQRSVYTDAELLANPSFHAARSLSALMVVGALGMLLFGRDRLHKRAAVIACTAWIAFEALLGGRGGALVALFAMALVWHYGVRRLRPRSIAALSLLGILAFGYIYTARFEARTASEAAADVVSDASRPKRLDDAAFMLRTVPHRIPYQGFGPMLSGVSRAVPGLRLPIRESTWGVIVTHLYGGRNPYEGAGADNFARAAELYMARGWVGVVIGSTAVGILFGLLFEWQRRRPLNPFLLIFTALVLVSFYGGITARTPAAVGEILVSAYLPVVALAALSLPSSRRAQRLLLVGYAAFGSFAIYLLVRGVGLPYDSLYIGAVKAVVGGLLAVVYVGGVGVIKYAGTAFWHSRPAENAATEDRRPAPALVT